MAKPAQLKSIEVTNKEPNSVDLAFNGKKFRLNGYQVTALAGVLEEIKVECQAGLPEDAGVEISGVSR